MQKNQSGKICKKLKLLKKQAARHLLTAKSQFDFVKGSQAAESNNRKTLRVKSIARDLKI